MLVNECISSAGRALFAKREKEYVALNEGVQPMRESKNE